jgi:hypothetical protein
MVLKRFATPKFVTLRRRNCLPGNRLSLVGELLLKPLFLFFSSANISPSPALPDVRDPRGVSGVTVACGRLSYKLQSARKTGRKNGGKSSFAGKRSTARRAKEAGSLTDGPPGGLRQSA